MLRIRAFALLLQAIESFLGDLIFTFIEHVLNMWLLVLSAIPIPGFISGVTICGTLGQAGPIASWAIGTLRLGEGLALIAAAFVFRMVRKILTLAQW